jgi:hypothetical protein
LPRVTLRRREIELAVERPLVGDGPAGGVVRLSARFEVSDGAAEPTPQELAGALDQLRTDLDALVGPPIATLPVARTDRDLAELIGAYHPRQRELIDLLRDEGELSPAEHARLAEYLAREGSTPRPAPRPFEPAAPAPIATVPLAAIPAESGRPVPELLRTYQITSLKQAGAVRARRQISFGEYMALKRHFERDDRSAGSSDAPRAPSTD